MGWLEKAKKFERCSRKVYDSVTDTYHCAHCGRVFDGKDVIWTYDHYLPNSMNGMTNAENLFPVCFTCNNGRKDVLVDGREFYKYITKEAYEEMINSISHQKVMNLLYSKK
jgi:5-methylcytosine-specific restriction endonuclease McrA